MAATGVNQLYISTHILTRRMTNLPNVSGNLSWHFNSHPHEEDDIRRCDFVYRVTISTHILTRRMTNQLCSVDPLVTISTHILTRRMTCCFPCPALIVVSISTHILTRRMTCFVEYHHIPRSISTHILTRRMTYSVPNATPLLTFQLTSSRGG